MRRELGSALAKRAPKVLDSAVRSLAPAALALSLIASSGCVDICVLSGAPCDSHADCEGGQLCRLRRGFEVGCLFAAGICVDGGCGSADDCGAEECCHPETNTCVTGESYAGACDPRTCGDCAECTLGLCETRGERASCSADAQCAEDEACRDERCREVCDYDADCNNAICSSGTCSEPYGSGCSSSADCAGLACYERTPAGAIRSGYCSGACDADGLCPLGHYFVCVQRECRMP